MVITVETAFNFDDCTAFQYSGCVLIS